MKTESVDIIIIGAGLSGIGAACHLKRQCPNKSFLILEGREAMGGTWDLFRYPGIRSDSDMFTLGYNFKPWTNPKAIADGDSIREYIIEAAKEHNVAEKIRYSHKVKSVAWDSSTSKWTITAEVNGEEKQYNCNFIFSCTGYYNYDEGYTPEFKDRKKFKGKIVHPQHWPEELDYTDKKVVIIGSGATAITLLPSMADKTEHITMLQRSPSYVLPVPQKDPMQDKLREYLPEKWVYRTLRARNVAFSMGFYQYARRFPDKMKAFIRSHNEYRLPEGYDMKHFTPKYDPWDERLCASPDADFFKAIKSGKASVETDHIDHFTKTGIQLKSGKHLDADIIITATGLNIQLMGGVDVTVDGNAVEMNERMCYRGVLIENLPNLAMVFGYTNASWTLKADLVSEYVCKLINHMDKKGLTQVQPINNDKSVHHEPFMDLQSGYVQRAEGKVPQQGNKLPWKLYQNYALDFAMLKFGRVHDGALKFQ